MQVLGLSGSLRAASLNSMLLRATARLAPRGIELRIFAGLDRLPLFNVDREAAEPDPVAALRAALNAAAAVLIASPEYAHGVSGVIKNALDWMVGNETFVNKRIALLNASPRATLAQAALRETLATMSAVVVGAACASVPLLGSSATEDGIVNDPTMARTLRQALKRLGAAAR